MGTNVVKILPFSESTALPRLVFLNSTETYETLTNPGFLNSVSLAGIEFLPNDFVFTMYNEGIDNALFTVNETDKIFTLQVYNPNSNSFIFTNVQFVSKGGSD